MGEGVPSNMSWWMKVVALSDSMQTNFSGLHGWRMRVAGHNPSLLLEES